MYANWTKSKNGKEKIAKSPTANYKAFVVSIKIYDLLCGYSERLDFARQSELETHECTRTEALREYVKEQIISGAY